jgi:uncharacterized membrane protein YkvA (DUF1232 family)
MLEKFKTAAKHLKREVMTLYFVARDSRTPWYARGLAFVVVGYALSPIDLIPDAIPVLGLLDDLILVPAGIWLVLKLVPQNVLTDARVEAAKAESRPVSYVAAGLMIVIWALALIFSVRWAVGFFKARA